MAKKQSTRSRLVDRAAKSRPAKESRRKARRVQAESAAEARNPAGANSAAENPAAMSIGGLQIQGLQLENLEDTVRTVVSYVKENPLAAAAVALGAGVALTSVYWDGGLSALGDRSRRRR